MDLIGQDVGRYRIVEKSGSMAGADIYRAYQANLDRYVTIEVFRMPAGEGAESFRSRFEQRMVGVSRLRHANILRILDYGVQGGLAYIVTKDVSRASLAARLPGPLPLGEAFEIVQQVGEALAYAHARGVIHGEVGPEEVFFDERGRPLLAGFGLAGVSQDSEVSKEAQRYTPPELKQGQPDDARSDVYALGMMLKEMVSGPGQRLPKSVRKAVARATAKAHTARFASVEDMLAALWPVWFTGRHVAAQAAGAGKRGLRSWVWAALALLAVSLGIAVAWLVPGVRQAISSLGSPAAARVTPTSLAVPTLSPTAVAVLPTHTPTVTPSPTLTATPTQTPTSTALPTSTATRTPVPTSTHTPSPTPLAQAVASRSASIFAGPSSYASEVAIVGVQESVTILGCADAQEYGRWLYVRNRDGTEGFVYEPWFTYAIGWDSLTVVEPQVPVEPSTSRASGGLVIAPGPLKIEYVWPAAVCDKEGGWTAYFDVKISGGDGKNYTLYWDQQRVPFEAKEAERDVAVIHFPGDRALFIGTVWVESGGQRVGRSISLKAPDSC